MVRKGILEICRGLRAIEGVEELCLTTNASLLTQFAKPLREAGVDRLNISLDTLKKDRFAQITRCGKLEDVWDGIAAAQAVGFTNLKLDTVLIGGFNEDAVPDFVDLTRTHPWEVRFIELMPMGECAQWDRGCFLSGDEVLSRCPDLMPIAHQGVARRFRLPNAQGTVGLISPMSHAFCSECSRIRLTADGHLKGCLHAREESSVRGLHGVALTDAIAREILKKPKQHHLTQGASETPRPMHAIGG